MSNTIIKREIRDGELVEVTYQEVSTESITEEQQMIELLSGNGMDDDLIGPVIEKMREQSLITW